ncbi:MAG: hypothetical protein ACK5MO_02140, partial [Planctomyces sp.]
HYFEDGSVELACPPLKALLHIMTRGNWEGLTIHDPAFRNLFTLESMLQSEWYQERLQKRQEREQSLWQRHVQSLDTFLNSSDYNEEKLHLDIVGRLDFARQMLAKVSATDYLTALSGTLGADRL